MGMDRFIKWSEPPEWGAPTIEKIAQVCREFLGPRWSVRITDPTWIVAECSDPQTFHLRSEYGENSSFVKGWDSSYGEFTRGFEVCFQGKHGEKQTSVITRSADSFTSALADRFTKIIARWWHGEIEWPS